MKLKYRTEIDGLRAIAVIAVMLFHANFTAFSGGFVGVDVFFVISGYLITAVISEEIKTGTFSIVSFYERRIRRILPALFVVCLATIPFAWLWMLPKELDEFSQSLVAVSLFASNILFWREENYFSAAADLKPLLHIWSLAIEEQFYVAFPVFLLLSRKLSREVLQALLLAIVILSFGIAVWGIRKYPEATFYLLPTRAWELTVGALLAVLGSSWSAEGGRLANLASLLGLFMIISTILVPDESGSLMVLRWLASVVGTALVIVFAKPQTVVCKFLSISPIVNLGLISYSTYLWHQPLFAFARIRLLNGVPPFVYLVLSGLALGLGYISWYLIEQPFRNRHRINRRQLISAAAAITVATIAFGLVGHTVSNMPGWFSPSIAQMAAWEEDRDHRAEKCSSGATRYIDPKFSCIYGNDMFPDFNIIGDSHGAALSSQLAKALSAKQHSLRQLTYDGCAPVVGFNRAGHECAKYNAEVRDFLLSSSKPEVIILVSRWNLFFEGQRFNNMEGGVEYGATPHAVPLDQLSDFKSDAKRIDVLGELTRNSIQRLLDGGKRVVLVYPVPEVGWNVPIYLARAQLLGLQRDQPLSTSYEVFKERVKKTHEQLDLLKDDPRLLRVRPEEIFCNTIVSERCIAEIEGKPLYSDDDHLNSIGALWLSNKIVDAIKKKGWLSDATKEIGESTY